ncbi:uncharacterized protein HMPREF1541_02222 [Cyphellophora europaea CBS 101466]|uniref:N-acetyltransferase domain-containing protein n=1 Tax=Cyphellophora europaea (strain CBS 101466) TaxID=1220924 RepID=W2S536_CYPE1|nr:uncharacterized protein HMPREF1541_02222 [Cyphellophora europaea CBS 101466]ETN43064.1 hypothetical protein HMPREF1541_02222 [Cyphellophora europaea CBS 101466]
MPLHLNPLSKSPPNPAGESDIYLLPALSAIQLRAWLSTPLYSAIYPGPPSTHPGIVDSSVKRHRRALLSDPTYHFVSLVGCHDPEVGEPWQVVAFVKYAVLEYADANAVEAGKVKARGEEREWAEGTNVALANWVWGAVVGVREKYGEELGRYVLVDILATEPGWQRQGAGRMLMQEVCREADERGWPCLLEGSEEGRRLYEQMGFVAREEIWVDMGRWEGGKDKGEGWRGEGAREGVGEGWYRMVVMTRAARAKETGS